MFNLGFVSKWGFNTMVRFASESTLQLKEPSSQSKLHGILKRQSFLESQNILLVIMACLKIWTVLIVLPVIDS